MLLFHFASLCLVFVKCGTNVISSIIATKLLVAFLLPGYTDCGYIVVPSPCEGVKLLLSMRELRAFDEMLENSDAELKSLEMIKLFQ